MYFSYINLDWTSLTLSCLTFTELLESIGLCLLYERGVFHSGCTNDNLICKTEKETQMYRTDF